MTSASTWSVTCLLLSEGVVSGTSLSPGPLPPQADGYRRPLPWLAFEVGSALMILIVSGVAGSGKTTIGKLIAARLGWEFADGDAFHSEANVAKMESGQPLCDEDRWPWIAAIDAWMDAHIAEGKSAVVACSALAHRYRNALLTGRDQAYMVFLEVSKDEVTARLKARLGHFFPAGLIESQFAEMELPDPDEHAKVVQCVGAPEQLADQIIHLLGLA
jgi:gluconokinase